MGARDTRLNRDVALKILPELFAADPDRVARFKREARRRSAPPEIMVVKNWFEELKRLAPGN